MESLAVVHSHILAMRRGRPTKGGIFGGSPSWVLLSPGFLSAAFLPCSRTWLQQLHFYVFSDFFILGMDFLFLLWYSGFVTSAACRRMPDHVGKKAVLKICYTI